MSARRHGVNIWPFGCPGADWLADACGPNTAPADKLADVVVEELRCRRILPPTRSALEAIIHLAIRHDIRIAHHALAGGPTDGQRLDLEKLLDACEETNIAVLAWTRTPARSPAVANLGKIAERIRFLRSLSLPLTLMERVPVI